MSSFPCAYDLQDLQPLLSPLAENAVIFIDVDDTLITPLSKMFRWGSPYRFLIEDLKRDPLQISNFDTLLSHWRLHRKSMLVNQDWPQFLKDLKQRHPVYGLTHMGTHPLGSMSSLEEWRYGELRGHGISFTPSFHNTFKRVLKPLPSSPPLFFQGIFMTGSLTKGQVLELFLETQTPSQIILIDDREEHLRDLKNTCERYKIDFLGIFFKGMETLEGLPNPRVAALQKEHLLTKAIWLEDEEAESLLSS